MQIIDYNRREAVAYADRWAYFRNPRYLDFSDYGGDCTNFASQCLYAGSGVMNYTPTYGWFYISSDNRTASWTGVEYFYNFLTQNEGLGPFASVVDISQVEPGDFVQLRFTQNYFEHTPVITRLLGPPSPANIWVAAHSVDANCRPLDSYQYTDIRFLHIEGVRVNGT